MRLGWSLLACLFALAAAAPARAFCRTTTEPISPSYNPVEQGCLGGTPLSWPSMPVGYQIYQGASAHLSLADVTTIADRSFAKWPAATCAGDSTLHPALSVKDLGPTDVGDPLLNCDGGEASDGGACLSPTAVHGIYFRDDAWPYVGAPDEIALTTVTFGVDDGHILAAVTEVNTFNHDLTTTVSNDPNALSLEAVLTHEAGHFVGMAHSQDTSAIMYAFYQGDAVSLTSDDTIGICSAYPPAPPSQGCALHDRLPGGDANAPLVLGAVVLGVGGYRRRRRKRAASFKAR